MELSEAKRRIVLRKRQELTRSVQNAPKEVSPEQNASLRVNSDHGEYRARCGIVRHRRCPNPRVPRSTPSAYSQRTKQSALLRALETELIAPGEAELTLESAREVVYDARRNRRCGSLMSDVLTQTSERPITVRMSIGRALAHGAKFNLYIFLLVLLPSLISGRFTVNLQLVATYLFLSALVGLGARELLKVSISPKGIGRRRRPIYWREITEIERQGKTFFLPHWQIHATYQPTVMVADAVAGRPEFRDAVERFSPSDSPIRNLPPRVGAH